MEHVEARPESLATFLARLRPGDRCTCCGAALRPVVQETRPARTGTHVAGASRPQTLVCPDCGCEISEDPGADAEGHLRELIQAA